MRSCYDIRAWWERFIGIIRSCSLLTALLLTNSSATLLAVVRTTPVANTDLAAINDSLLDSIVEAGATVKAITKTKEGDKNPVKIYLVDDTGSIIVVAWPEVFEPLATIPRSPRAIWRVPAPVSRSTAMRFSSRCAQLTTYACSPKLKQLNQWVMLHRLLLPTTLSPLSPM